MFQGIDYNALLEKTNGDFCASKFVSLISHLSLMKRIRTTKTKILVINNVKACAEEHHPHERFCAKGLLTSTSGSGPIHRYPSHLQGRCERLGAVQISDVLEVVDKSPCGNVPLSAVTSGPGYHHRSWTFSRNSLCVFGSRERQDAYRCSGHLGMLPGLSLIHYSKEVFNILAQCSIKGLLSAWPGPTSVR